MWINGLQLSLSVVWYTTSPMKSLFLFQPLLKTFPRTEKALCWQNALCGWLWHNSGCHVMNIHWNNTVGQWTEAVMVTILTFFGIVQISTQDSWNQLFSVYWPAFKTRKGYEVLQTAIFQKGLLMKKVRGRCGVENLEQRLRKTMVWSCKI